MKMTCYKSFKEDSEFNSKKIAVIERFTDEDVSTPILLIRVVLISFRGAKQWERRKLSFDARAT
jgi:hypothetical protein